MEAYTRILFEKKTQAEAAGMELGWREWLRRMAPATFTSEFAQHHAEYWEWYWPTLQKRKLGESIAEDDLAFAAIWPRGGGKSSTVEWGCIAEGALLGKGYVLYLCGTQDMAEKHVLAIKNRLEGAEIAKYYPGMGNAKIGKYGANFGWRQNMLITENGWGIAALGCDVGVRGGKLIDVRPTMIVIDDLDDLHDSHVMVQKKIDELTRSIFFTGTGQTLILFAQNLIHRHSVLNQMLTGKVPILTKRRQSGPIKAIEGLRIDFKADRYVITAGEPIWAGQGLEECQALLDKAGPEAFLAECQHDFTAVDEGLVLPKYDERIHVITWSEFEAVYGHRHIPDHWGKEVGMDWGSTGYGKHPTCLSFFTTAADNSRKPGLHFLYKGMSFGESVIVDDVGRKLLEYIGKEEGDYHRRGFRRFRMSHEARSERDTLRIKYKLPFQAALAGKQEGIAMLNHYLDVDPALPHPFKPGIMGRSLLYWIVEDNELEFPKTDAGLARWREEIVDWRWIPQDLKDSGLSREIPVKYRDDAMDSMRMVTQKWMPPRAPLTKEEKLEASYPENLRKENIPDDPAGREAWERGRWMTAALKQKRSASLAMQKALRNGEAYDADSQFGR